MKQVITVLFGITALVLASCGGGSPRPAEPGVTITPNTDPRYTPLPTLTPTATATPTQDLVRGVAIRRVSVGKEEPMPPGLMLVAAPACDNCHNGFVPTMRIYRLGDAVVTDPIPFPARVFQYSADERFQTVYALACERGDCGGWAPSSPDALPVLYRSEDGGYSWSRIRDVPRETRIAGLVRGEVLLRTAPAEEGGHPRLWYVNGEEVRLPPNAKWGFVEQGELRFTDLGGNEVTPSGELRPFQPADAVVIDGNPGGVLLKLPGGGDIIAFTWAALPGERGFRTIVAERSAEQSIIRAWDTSAEGQFSNLHLVGGEIYGKFDGYRQGGPFDQRPQLARLDRDANRIHPILEASESIELPMHAAVHYYLEAHSFARVLIPGDCLNVRSSPSLGGTVVDCAVHGAALAVEGDPVVGDGVTWLNVTAPSGVRGYVSTSFVER